MDLSADSSATNACSICKPEVASINFDSVDKKKENILKRLVEKQMEAKRILLEIDNVTNNEKASNNLIGRPQGPGSKLEFKKNAESSTECSCSLCKIEDGTINLDDILNGTSANSLDKEKAKRLKQLSGEQNDVKRIISEIESSINNQNTKNNFISSPQGTPLNLQFKKNSDSFSECPCNLKINKNMLNPPSAGPVEDEGAKDHLIGCSDSPCSKLKFMETDDESAECSCNPCEKGGGNIDLYEILNSASTSPVEGASTKSDLTDGSPCEKDVGNVQIGVILSIGSAGSVEAGSPKEDLTAFPDASCSNLEFMKTAASSTECPCSPCEKGAGNIKLDEILHPHSAGLVEVAATEVGCPDGPCSNLQFMETAEISTKCPCTPCEKGGGRINIDEILNPPVELESGKEDPSGCPDGPCPNLQFMKSAASSTECPCSPCEKGGGKINLDEILNPPSSGPVEDEDVQEDITGCSDGPCSNLQFMQTADVSTKCPCTPCEKGGVRVNIDEILIPPVEVESGTEDLSGCPDGPCPNLQFMKSAASSTECPCSPCEKGGGNINLDEILNPSAVPEDVEGAKEYLTGCPDSPYSKLQFMETADASSKCSCAPCENGGGIINLDEILNIPEVGSAKEGLIDCPGVSKLQFMEITDVVIECPSTSYGEGGGIINLDGILHLSKDVLQAVENSDAPVECSCSFCGSLNLDDILNRYANYFDDNCACRTCAKEVTCGDLEEIINRYSAVLQSQSSNTQNDENSKKDLPGGRKKRGGSINVDDLLNCNLANDNAKELIQLAKEEKECKARIRQLEEKEVVYSQAFRNANTCSKSPHDGRLSDFQQGNQDIIQQNQDYAKDLVDIRLQTKCCMARMTETVNRHKRRSQQLEQQLVMAMKKSRDTGTTYQNQMRDMKRQLECQCNCQRELIARNKILKEQVCLLQCRCDELQNDLVNQRLSKAHTVRRLEEQKHFNFDCGVGDLKTNGVVEGECDNLNTVARNLSRTLLFMDSCDSCRNKVPGGVKDLEKELVGLLDLVERRRA